LRPFQVELLAAACCYGHVDFFMVQFLLCNFQQQFQLNFAFHFQANSNNNNSNSNMLYAKPPRCPQQQQQQLPHLRGLVDLSANAHQLKPELNCATPPQSRRRFFIPKHLKSPFGIYKNRNNGHGSEQNYTFSGKFVSLPLPLCLNSLLIYLNILSVLSQKHDVVEFVRQF